MDPGFNKPIHLAEGISLRKLLTEANEIKLDFNKKVDLNDEVEEEESTDEEVNVLGTIEEMVDNAMLSSPEYHTFEQLAKKMTECVCPKGGVRILIMEEGEGPLVNLENEVSYHYACYWEGAKIPFDSSLNRSQGKPLRQRIGEGMLPGVAFGFLSVHGPKARFMLLIEPQMAFMDMGAPPRIKPGQTVLFVITLFDVRNRQAAARFNDLPRSVQAQFEVAMAAIKDIRAEGKELFQRHKYKKAINCYEQAISIIRLTEPENETQEKEVIDVKVNIYVNLAVCYYKIEKPKYVLIMCENIDSHIDINTHCKGLFYYGRAYQMLGKIDDAIKYYKKALKLEPKNKEIGLTLAELDSKNKQSMAHEKSMWKKAFKSEEKEEIVYDVDDDFKNSVVDMCHDLAGRDDYAKFDLPTGLTKNEIDCIKSLTSQFRGLVVSEDGVGKRKKVSIIKKVLG